MFTHVRIFCVALLLEAVSLGALAQEIPYGFKVDRYVRVWERNPFTLVKPTAPEKLPSAFEKLFLASWLKDGGNDVVLVQNSETNEVQRITVAPNRNNLRLIELHLDPNPQFVEAVISDGKEQGTVKFQLDKDAPSSPAIVTLAQVVPQVPVERSKPPPPPRKYLSTAAKPEH